MTENVIVKTRKKNLFRSVARNCADAFRHFPVAFVFLIASTFVWASDVWNYPASTEIAIPLLLACMGALASSLITGGRSKVWNVIGHILAIVIALLFYREIMETALFQWPVSDVHNTLRLRCALWAYIAMLIGLIFFPFRYCGDDAISLSWSVTMRGCMGVGRALIVAFCVFAAMHIISYAGVALLDLVIFGSFWLQFVPTQLFGMLCIGAFVPKAGASATPFRLAGFSRGVFTFLFVPLEAIYLLIFYIYLVSVVFGGTNPVREIGWHAMGVFGVFCMQRYVFAGAIAAGDNAVARCFNRMAPWLLIVPTLLLSWSIGHQLVELGFTVNRGYVAAMNLWMCGIIIWWLVTGARKVWVIPTSLWIVLAITSLPVGSICDITEWTMRSRLRTAMEKTGWTLPVTSEFYQEKAPEALTAADRSLERYLETEMGTGSLHGLVVFPDKKKRSSDDIIGHSAVVANKYVMVTSADTFNEVPAGCVAVSVYDFGSKEVTVKGETVRVVFGDAGSLTFSYTALQAEYSSRSATPPGAIRVVGSTGAIKGAAISNIKIFLDVIDDRCQKGSATLSGTLFITPEGVDYFTRN